MFVYRMRKYIFGFRLSDSMFVKKNKTDEEVIEILQTMLAKKKKERKILSLMAIK